METVFRTRYAQHVFTKKINLRKYIHIPPAPPAPPGEVLPSKLNTVQYKQSRVIKLRYAQHVFTKKVNLHKYVHVPPAAVPSPSQILISKLNTVQHKQREIYQFQFRIRSTQHIILAKKLKFRDFMAVGTAPAQLLISRLNTAQYKYREAFNPRYNQHVFIKKLNLRKYVHVLDTTPPSVKPVFWSRLATIQYKHFLMR